eukprot:3061808-Prymnesium_polylepis.3
MRATCSPAPCGAPLEAQPPERQHDSLQPHATALNSQPAGGGAALGPQSAPPLLFPPPSPSAQKRARLGGPPRGACAHMRCSFATCGTRAPPCG